MISKKLKVFLAAVFALSLGMSVTTVSLKANKAESVAAYNFEDEDPLEEPVSSEDPNEEDEESPIDSGSDAKPEEVGEEDIAPEEPVAEQSEEGAPKESGTEEKTTSVGAPTAKEILKALINTFKDAWADLVAHIKRWLKLN